MKTTSLAIALVAVVSPVAASAAPAAPAVNDLPKPVVITVARPDAAPDKIETVLRTTPAPAWDVSFAGWSLGTWGKFLPGPSSSSAPSNPGITLFSIRF